MLRVHTVSRYKHVWLYLVERVPSASLHLSGRACTGSHCYAETLVALPSLTETPSVSTRSLPDNTQLLQSCPPDYTHVIDLIKQTGISDVKIWMTQNKMKLNDMTADHMMKSKRSIFPDAQPTSVRVGTADIPFMTFARNLGFMISNNI